MKLIGIENLFKLTSFINFDYFLQRSKSDYPWEYVADNKKRKCEVIIYVRVTEGSTTHWAICFNWGDKISTYEGTEQDRKLIPVWYEGHPSDEFQWLESERVSINCSPREVNMKSKAVEINGSSCDFHRVSSKNWVVALSASLGIKLKNSDENQLPPLMDMLIDFYEATKFGKKKLKSSL